MPLDADTKAYLDARHNELMEKLDVQGRALRVSNEQCAKLNHEVNDLRSQLAAAISELERVKAGCIQDFTSAQTRVDEQDEVIKMQDKTIRHLGRDVGDNLKLLHENEGVIAEQAVLIDDLQQYGRRQSVRVQGVTVVPGEGDDDSLLLEQVNKALEPANIALQASDVIRFHRSSAIKDDKFAPGTKSSQVLIKLKHWCVRAKFQGVNTAMRLKEKKKEKGCRVYHDLTKRRLDLLNTAREDIAVCPGWFAYADINSGLKLRCEKRFFNFNTKAELDTAIAQIKSF